jgi:Tfp pilus assembly protein PilZ
VIKARLRHDVVDGVDGAENQHEGYLLNVSFGGAFLAMPEPLSVGTETELTAPLPWKLGILKARVRVVWQKTPGVPGAPNASIAGVGLIFTEMTSEMRCVLEAYVERFEKLVAELEASPAE